MKRSFSAGTLLAESFNFSLAKVKSTPGIHFFVSPKIKTTCDPAFLSVILSHNKTLATMEPIPLRTLTTLLNYERMISDPRYKDMALQQSSVADDEVLPRFLANYSKHLTNELKSIESVSS